MTISLRRWSPARSSMMEAQATKTHKRSRVWQGAAVLVAGLLLGQVSAAQNTGINFPPNQGTSNAGAFQPGIYNYTYTDTDIKNANATFNMMRLPVNVATADDPASLQKMKGYVDQFAGHYAIIVMFGTLQPGETGHGNGLPNGLAAMGTAWYNINQVFQSYPNVHYEIFNEPFGYCPKSASGAVDCAALTLAQKQHYVSDMEQIITDAGLSKSDPRIILDAIGYASNVNDTVEGGWGGDIAYHFYYNWIGQPATQSNYSNKVQGDLATYGQRVWITEFGADLRGNNTCYDTYDPNTTGIDQNINTLRGLDDALRALRANGHGIKGAFAYHGWNNGDSYDYWASTSTNGACKIREIETHD